MGWREIVKIATQTQTRILGEEVIVSIDGENDLKIKAIFSIHNISHKHYQSEIDSCSLIASILKEQINDVQSVVKIIRNNKKYGIMQYKIDSEGYYHYYLKE